jgi:DNA polymerase
VTSERSPAPTDPPLDDVIERLRDHALYARAMGVRDVPVVSQPMPSLRVPSPAVAEVAPRYPTPVGRPRPPVQSAPHHDPATALAQLRNETIGDCQRCKLAPTRTQVVFGVGNPRAALVFVGEAPGADEDAQGIPFVGRAGQLLTKIIEAMGLRRDDIYIANIIKCRPPGNRNPQPDEIASCEPFLIAQLDIIRPKVICALGTFAAQTLLKTKEPISRLRGRWQAYQGIPLMPTYHPAYLLRNANEKETVWKDVQLILTQLGLPVPPRAKTLKG